MNSEILEKVDEIIEYIKETTEYKDYIYLKEKLEANDKVKKLVSEVKKLQKELVRKEVSKEDTKELENKYKETLSELDKIPLYKDYSDSVNTLNNMYTNIKERLDNYFNDKLN